MKMHNPSEKFDEMMERDGWGGFGYLGERRHALQRGESVALADRVADDIAFERGLTDEELFIWADSTYGRHYGDVAFSVDSYSEIRRITLLSGEAPRRMP